MELVIMISMKMRQVDSLGWMFHVSARLFNASSGAKVSNAVKSG